MDCEPVFRSLKAFGAPITFTKSEWENVLRPRFEPWNKGHIKLCYPYVITRRNEHADLLAVNSLVPAHFPDRDDVCQEIMLAMWKGAITLDMLRNNRSLISGFIRSFKRLNLENDGYVISLDVPRRDKMSWYDVLPDDPHWQST